MSSVDRYSGNTSGMIVVSLKSGYDEWDNNRRMQAGARRLGWF